jgi:hypothetical protein
VYCEIKSNPVETKWSYENITGVQASKVKWQGLSPYSHLSEVLKALRIFKFLESQKIPIEKNNIDSYPIESQRGGVGACCRDFNNKRTITNI